MSKEIKYIEKRSQAIAKYSDKLRQSIKDIDTEMTPFLQMQGLLFLMTNSSMKMNMISSHWGYTKQSMASMPDSGVFFLKVTMATNSGSGTLREELSNRQSNG